MKAEQLREINSLSTAARQAVPAGDWAQVLKYAKRILEIDSLNAEGWFLNGLAEQAYGYKHKAVAAFQQALKQNPERYDAAVELAQLQWSLLEHAQAKELLDSYQHKLSNSPLYLHKAAETYSKLALHDHAWPLYKLANTLQPNIDRFEASLAACSTLTGHLEQAKVLYQGLLKKNPNHQRNHYALSNLERVTDDQHLVQMQDLLKNNKLPDEKNIFLCYAIGKEFEDMEQWEQAFSYYKRAGDAAAKVALQSGYRLDDDIELLNSIVETYTEKWLTSSTASTVTSDKTPIFVVGLPRTGTTLTERIIASHSQVESADESFFLQIAIKQASGVDTPDSRNAQIMRAASQCDAGQIGMHYLRMVDYRLTGKPNFAEKYPFNFMYLGVISKAFPDAKIVRLKRHPMDACMALFKQSYFSFAYTLDDLADYYIAYHRLDKHWSRVLGDRIVEVEYEKLVADPESQIRMLLKNIDLDFETACLDFHMNKSASATASSVQIREKPHTRSVEKWRNWESQLEPLHQRLLNAEIFD